MHVWLGPFFDLSRGHDIDNLQRQCFTLRACGAVYDLKLEPFWQGVLGSGRLRRGEILRWILLDL